MSTNLMTYLSYISNWENADDQDIQDLIDEQNLFKNLGDFDATTSIDNEFSTLISLAKTVRDLTIEADAIQIAADAAAIGAIWSFGIGMAAFAALEAEEVITQKVISDKSKDLNDKLKSADVDIAAGIDPNVEAYIKKYKANNDVIVSQAPKGLDVDNCRAILLQFMAQVEKTFKGEGGLTVGNFKELAGSARLAFHSKEINKVYNALDKLNLSNKGKGKVQEFMNTIKGLEFKGKRYVDRTVPFVQLISITVVYRIGVKKAVIQETAERAGLSAAEYGGRAFMFMDAVGKFAAGVAIILSVVSILLSILDIVNVVEQTEKMVDELEDHIKPNYVSFFNGIKEASQEYNKAINEED